MNEAIKKYFAGERSASVMFLVLGVLSLGAAIYIGMNDLEPTFEGMLLPLFLLGFIEIIIGWSILKRTPEQLATVLDWANKKTGQIKTTELPRIEGVIASFKKMRLFQFLMAGLGAAIMMYYSGDSNWWIGFGLALFVKSIIIMSLDFFGAARADLYHKNLIENIK